MDERRNLCPQLQFGTTHVTDTSKEQKTKKARSASAELKLARKAFAKARHSYLTTDANYKLAAERLKNALKALEDLDMTSIEHTACTCGHSVEEHGHDPQYPGSTAC